MSDEREDLEGGEPQEVPIEEIAMSDAPLDEGGYGATPDQTEEDTNG